MSFLRLCPAHKVIFLHFLILENLSFFSVWRSYEQATHWFLYFGHLLGFSEFTKWVSIGHFFKGSPLNLLKHVTPCFLKFDTFLLIRSCTLRCKLESILSPLIWVSDNSFMSFKMWWSLWTFSGCEELWFKVLVV